MKIGRIVGDGLDYAQLDKLPDEFVGMVERIELKDDYRVVDGKVVGQRTSLFMTIRRTDENGNMQLVTQKFTPRQVPYLDEALTRLGYSEYEEIVEDKPFVFKKTVRPFMGERLSNGNETRPRWLPVEPVVKKARKKKKEEPAE